MTTMSSQTVNDSFPTIDLYHDWPGDPGASPDDGPPFPMKVGERFQFMDGIYYYKRRTTAGLFFFEPDDGAGPLLRSSWRLRIEFAERILIRLDRGAAKHRCRAHQAAAVGKVDTETFKTAPGIWDNRILIPKIKREYSRRCEAGLPHLPITGPREAGGHSAPHYPPRDLAELIANLATEHGIPPASQRSWKTVAKKLKDFSHLETVPTHQLLDGRTIAYHPSRIDPLVEEIAKDVIERDFATRTFESPSGTTLRVNQRLDAINTTRSEQEQLPMISRSAVERIISTLPGIALCAAKDGPKRAKKVYDVTGKLTTPREPMTVVEFDWHKIDLETKYPAQAKYLSELSGIPIPRLWLIAGLDTCTGWPTGYSWSVVDPAEADIMRAFAHMCRYKPSYSHLGAKGKWLAHGFPKLIKIDRGKANLAHDIIRAGGVFGIEFSLDEKANPKKRPYIERFFGTVETDFISKLPGAVGRNISVRPEQRATAAEMIAIDELNGRFIEYVCDRYANHTARTRLFSPRDAWMRYEARNPGWAPDTARSEEDLDRELRISAIRTATSEGLVWEGVWYNGPAIARVRSDYHAHRRGNPKVEMRIHPDNIADVIVRDPNRITGGWKKSPDVECLYRGYAPGKSVEVHLIVHSALMTIKKRRQKVTEQLLADTYVAVTRRGIEKVMGRRATTRTVGHVARLGQLTTFDGAMPLAGQARDVKQSDLSSTEDSSSAEGPTTDAAAARARIMSSRDLCSLQQSIAIRDSNADDEKK